MEKENYRANLQLVREKFGDTPLIPLKDVAAWLGRDVRTLKRDRDFQIKKLGRMYYATAVGTARFLA